MRFASYSEVEGEGDWGRRRGRDAVVDFAASERLFIEKGEEEGAVK